MSARPEIDQTASSVRKNRPSKNRPSQLPAQQILPARSRRPKEPGTQLPQVSQSTFKGTMSPWLRNTGPHSERSGLNLFNLLRLVQLAFQVQLKALESWQGRPRLPGNPLTARFGWLRSHSDEVVFNHLTKVQTEVWDDRFN